MGISPMRCISYRYLPHQYSGAIKGATWVCKTMPDSYPNTIPPIVAITTKIYFDKDSVVPKLCFKPVDRLDADTYETVCNMIDHPNTLRAITMTVPITSEPVSPFSAVEGFELNAN